MGWVRLIDLVQATKYSPQQLVKTFAVFGCQGCRINDDLGGLDMVMDVVFARSGSEIEDKLPEIKQFTSIEIQELIRTQDPETIWVRGGFSNTVLRLIALKFDLQPINTRVRPPR